MGDDRRVVRTFEDLEVFQRAYRLSLVIHRASLQIAPIDQRVLSDQLRRAAMSICANIAEGFGKQRQSRMEFRRFVLIAMGSADEMQVWSRYCFDLGYADEATALAWRQGYREIARMLQGLAEHLRPSRSDP